MKRRDRGARLEYVQPGVYRVYGFRRTGAIMALEAVDQAVEQWCRRVRDV